MHPYTFSIFFEKQVQLLKRLIFSFWLVCRSRLKAKNLMYIKQILFVLEGLVHTLGGQMCDLVLYFMCVYLV